MKKRLVILGVVLVLVMVMFYCLVDNNPKEDYTVVIEENTDSGKQIEIINSIEVGNQEERTTPNTLMIYKTYYTKCKHYVQEYKDIDASLVNFNENELIEKCKKWNVDKFSSEEIELSKEKIGFCGEHYKIKLENNNIVIYTIDENGGEEKYEETGITTEYLTAEDVLKLTSGIYIYGKENLSCTIEDYE